MFIKIYWQRYNPPLGKDSLGKIDSRWERLSPDGKPMQDFQRISNIASDNTIVMIIHIKILYQGIPSLQTIIYNNNSIIL